MAKTRQIAIFSKAVSYVIYLTFPVHAAMMAVGFLHKDDCRVDVRLPRFLFFGGLAGLMAVLLRIVLEIKWWHIKKTHDGINYDPRAHPGLSMVRTVMYIFILFVVFWNINATSHVFSVQPNFEDESSESYCNRGAYQFTIVLVVIFDVLAGMAFLFWLTAIIAGICNPHFLVKTGYFPSSSEVSFNVKMKLKERKRRKSSNLIKSSGETTPPSKDGPSTPRISTPMISLTAVEPSNRFNVVDLESGEVKGNLDPIPAAKNRFTVAPALVESEAKDTIGDNKDGDGSDSDSSGDVYSPEEDRANMSIVRFGGVLSRRISTDYYSYFTAPPGVSASGGNGIPEEESVGTCSAAVASVSETKLDITNFPKGPLFESASQTNGATTNGGDTIESLEVDEKSH